MRHIARTREDTSPLLCSSDAHSDAHSSKRCCTCSPAASPHAQAHQRGTYARRPLSWAPLSRSAAHLAKRRREKSMGRLSAPARGNATLGRRLNPRATRRSRGAPSRSATTSFQRTGRSGGTLHKFPTSSSSVYRRASTSTTMRSTRACVSCSDGSTRTASRPQLRSSGTSRTRRRRASTARRRY